MCSRCAHASADQTAQERSASHPCVVVGDRPPAAISGRPVGHVSGPLPVLSATVFDVTKRTNPARPVIPRQRRATHASLRQPTEEQQPPEPKKRVNPFKWFREESFWRDVTTRTVATLVSAGLIYAFGISVGIFKTPTFRHQLVNVAYFSILVFMQVGVILGFTGIGDRFAEKRSPRVRFIIKTLLWLALIVGMISWVDLTLWHIPIWPWTSSWNHPPPK